MLFVTSSVTRSCASLSKRGGRGTSSKARRTSDTILGTAGISRSRRTVSLEPRMRRRVSTSTMVPGALPSHTGERYSDADAAVTTSIAGRHPRTHDGGRGHPSRLRRSKIRRRLRGGQRPGRKGMRVERDIFIERPPAEVFSYVADVRNDPSWHTDVLEVRSSTDAVGMGTVFNVKVRPSMGVSEGTMAVSRYEPPRLIEFQGRMGRMAPTVTNVCEPDGDGTRVTRRVELDPPGVM